MKIAIVGPIATENIAGFLDGETSHLPPGYGGAPLLATLIGELLKRGHEVSGFTTSTGCPLAADKWIAAEGHRFRMHYCALRPHSFRPKNGYPGRATDFFGLERACLQRAIESVAPDVVHAHWSYEFALAAIATGLPHVVTCHDAPQVVLKYSPNLYRLARYFMARRVLSRAQYLTAVSPYLQQKLETYARVPITVVPNPLLGHPSERGAAPRHYDPAHPRIAMVLNGWDARKNPKPALRAFAALRSTFPAAELDIMGSDYGVGGKAEAWAKSKGLTDGVHFMGRQPYPLLLAKLAESDLLLHPALEETFGMSIAEAMSLGVPALGGQASGAVPWVIGKSGRLVDVRSEQAIAQAAIELLKDSQGLVNLSAQARSATLSRFSPDTVAAAYECCYQQALSGGGGQ